MHPNIIRFIGNTPRDFPAHSLCDVSASDAGCHRSVLARQGPTSGSILLPRCVFALGYPLLTYRSPGDGTYGRRYPQRYDEPQVASRLSAYALHALSGVDIGYAASRSVQSFNKRYRPPR
eukprot:3702409-Rhodomonas_salina.1